MSKQTSRHISRRTFLQGLGAAGILAALSGCSPAPKTLANGFPTQSVWVTYPTGTGTYNDVAAIANMLTTRTGMRIRMIADNTGIGRLGQMISGTAQYSRTGDEYYYAFEGNDEYASEQWGPQKIRIMWAPPGNYGVLVRKDSGIQTVKDLRGKKYPRLISSTSMNRKLEAILHFEGLGVDDVEWVDIAYSEQAEALKTGKLDAMYQNVVGATIEELNSQYPIHWLNLGGGTPEQYETWKDLAPMVIPGEFTKGAGLAPGESSVNMQYSIPLTTMEERPVDEVRMILGAMHDNFDDYKDATSDAHKFGADEVLLTPLVIPYHEGAIQFLKKIGKWTPGLQKRNDALLDRERRMHEAWPGFYDEHKDADDLAQRWKQWKDDNLPELPEVTDV